MHTNSEIYEGVTNRALKARQVGKCEAADFVNMLALMVPNRNC